ncbi:MAG: class I fructose-bisphosphate aldolase [Patescibacteria group bacterium]
MNKDELIKTVARLMAVPKGILAIDESIETCNGRFEKLGIPTTLEKRQEWRELLVTAPDIEKYVSGFITFDETIRQSTADGKTFVSVLQSKGIDVGIKVDKGLKDLSLHSGDKITEGLDGLQDRMKEYKNMGATFAKWRAVFAVGDNLPSDACIKANANAHARYALICQEYDIVPIVEPEILITGSHSVEQCYEVSARVLKILFAELKALDVFMPGIILKTSMIISGQDALNRAPKEKVADMTLKCFKENVPNDVGGIAFLSGGQTNEESTENLNEMHKMGSLPWALTFSYGRGIQSSALKYWASNQNDVAGAQALLVASARDNSLASIGEYKK